MSLTRKLLAAMVALHMLWLAALWSVAPSSTRQKLPWLLFYSLICGAAVGGLPAHVVARLQQFSARFVHHEKLALLVLGTGAGGVSAAYAYYQPVLLPDEVYYLDAARIIATEGAASFFADYQRIPWLGSNHPPLVPLIHGGALQALGAHIFTIRLISVGLGVVTILLTYLVGKELYDRKTGLLAALFLLAFPLFPRMSAAATTDLPVTFFFTLTFFLTLRLLQTPTYRLATVLGFCISVGLLSKYTMVLIYPALFSVLALSGEFRRLMPYFGVLFLVSIGVLIIWAGYAYHNGILAGQTRTLAFYTGQVIATRSGRHWMLTALFWRVFPAIGIYNLPFLFLGGWRLLRRRNPANLFILAWIAPVFFFLLFTLPDPRYFLLVFPALAVMMACELQRLPKAAEQIIILALLLCSGALYLAVDWYRITHLFLR